ncbi:Catalase [Colletotrichum higginsianum IMI 349063]|uniref:Catalase n=1 Tax=Colletotrichum higginsianum (strain IMI 349063) TaxID=759273 RepID=A0A1B7YG22_COLHI|nr:Catalase [Colletotrichum higginsianum IMI 349063]OBR11121.1 Catalase [Colletotrichum higginsianum IMI 349063]
MAEMRISPGSLLRSIHGVAQAVKLSEAETEPIVQRLSASTEGLELAEWQSLFEDMNSDDEGHSLHHLAGVLGVALAVSFLREAGRHDRIARPDELYRCWNMVYRAISSNDAPAFAASRSAQGFLSVPLCSIVKDGSIDELFRLHVWLPDGKRGNPDFRLHSHQPFAQSWILAGAGKDRSWEVEQVNDPAEATHAGYALSWADAKGQGSAYKTHQSSSTVRNTGDLFRATETSSQVNVLDSTYVVPAAHYHTSEVAPDALCATLFFFDSHRGFVKDAGVLGPRDGESYTQLRDPAGVSPCELAEAVQAARSQGL